jgi:hypothetical protein
MAESRRRTDPDAPENPPRSVLNKNVRRSALWIYLAPLVVFFAGVGLMLVFWMGGRPSQTRELAEPAAEGTTGTERERAREDTPGGHNPDRTPSSASNEADERAGRVITEIGELLENNGRGLTGRRVDVRDVNVDRVESPTLFWIRDGNARVAVIATMPTELQTGRPVNVRGTVERWSDTVRIRASRVEPSR